LPHAFAEWERLLRVVPGHVGALKGMAFVCFQQGRLEDAEAYLRRAAPGGSPDPSIRKALDTVRGDQGGRRAIEADAPYSGDPRAAFAESLDGADQTALLLDRSGMV